MTPSLPRFAGTAAAVVAVLCAAGAWPTSRLAGTDGLAAMGIAAGISLAGAVVGVLPSITSSADRLEARLQSAMLGIGLRLFVTVAAVFGALQTGLVARMPFVAWVGIDYVALLLLEARLVLRAERPRSDGGPVSA